MKKTRKLLSVLLAVLMLTGCLGLFASAVNVLSSIDLTCPAPVAGGAFPTVADVECNTALKVNSIYIYEVNDNVSVKATAPFEAGKTYEIDITVATKTSSYNFDTNLSASVNDEGCRAVYLSKTSANVVWVVTVSAAPMYTVEIINRGDESCIVSGGGTYEKGTPVTLTATPGENYMFLRWNLSVGDDEYTSTSSTYTFNVYGDTYALAIFARPTGTDGFVSWNLDRASGTLTLSGNGPMNDYFPDPYNQGDSLYAPWGNLCYYGLVRRVVIEPGITTIGAYALDGGEEASIQSVSIPDTVTRIGEYAFTGNDELESVVIPGSVKTIEEGAFLNCKFLEKVTLGDGVKEIGEGAFESCNYLKTVTIPASVREIGYLAFNCLSLKTVNYCGSEAQWNEIFKDGDIFGTDVLEEGEVQREVTINFNYNPNPPQASPSGSCKYCGGNHSGFLGFFVGIFHSILALFGLRKK